MADIGDLSAADETITGSDEIVVHNVSKAAGSKDQRLNLTKLLADVLEYLESTWTPVITGSSSNPTVTYSTQAGKYTRIGNVVAYSFNVGASAYSGGSGTLRISLPIAAANSGAADSVRATVLTDGVDLPGTPVGVVFTSSGGNAYGVVFSMNDNASPTALTTADFAAGDSISVAGFYFV